jgi:hypothetical protein
MPGYAEIIDCCHLQGAAQIRHGPTLRSGYTLTAPRFSPYRNSPPDEPCRGYSCFCLHLCAFASLREISFRSPKALTNSDVRLG